MKFTDVKVSSEGGVHFNVKASDGEVEYLVNFAVERLLQEGIIAINELEEEQEVSLRETAH